MIGFDFCGKRILIGLLAICAMQGCAIQSNTVKKLPTYGADLTQTSVSGVSSGAAMALQFHVAYSGTVHGAGIIAGAPYYCAENSSRRVAQNCALPDANHPPPDAAHLKTITDSLANAGAIDDPMHLKDSRVWLFSGKVDTTVLRPVMDAVTRYYRFYLDKDRIAYKTDLNAGHAMITENYGRTCSYNGPPYINDCDYDAAGALLGQIYGTLNPPSSQLSGHLIAFDQSEFFPDGSAYAHGLSDTGFVYIPSSCESQPCRIHIAFHACRQNADEVGDAFYRHAGYNRWADSNGIIILYPQTITRYGWGKPFWNFNFIWNLYACWDWWGYDGPEYHTRNGSQIKAIHRMLDRLAETKESRRSDFVMPTDQP